MLFPTLKSLIPPPEVVDPAQGTALFSRNTIDHHGDVAISNCRDAAPGRLPKAQNTRWVSAAYHEPISRPDQADREQKTRRRSAEMFLSTAIVAMRTKGVPFRTTRPRGIHPSKTSRCWIPHHIPDRRATSPSHTPISADAIHTRAHMLSLFPVHASWL